MRLCSYVIFLLRDQWLIERLSEAMGAALFGKIFSPIPSRISARNLQSIKTFLTLELSQYRKSGTPVARFVNRAVRGPQRLPPTRKRRSSVRPAQTVPESGTAESGCQSPWPCSGQQASPCSELLHYVTRRRRLGRPVLPPEPNHESWAVTRPRRRRHCENGSRRRASR